MHVTQPEPEFFTKIGAARYSSLSERTIDAARARGDLPFYRFSSRRILIRRADLEKWLNRMRVNVEVQP